jgi:hypothetical protein
MTFKTTAMIAACVAFLLGAGYLFVGELVVGRWHIAISDSVVLIGRRIGALYVGLSVIFYLARTAPISVARSALSAGTAVALAILVVLGIYELVAGHVGPGILASMIIEALLATAFVRIFILDRKQTSERT